MFWPRDREIDAERHWEDSSYPEEQSVRNISETKSYQIYSTDRLIKFNYIPSVRSTPKWPIEYNYKWRFNIESHCFGASEITFEIDRKKLLSLWTK